MANFSAGSGYLPMFAVMCAIVSVPAALLLWTGMALPLKKVNGYLDYAVFKRRMLRIVLPVCIAFYILFVYMGASGTLPYSGGKLAYWPAILANAVILAFVPYLSSLFAAGRLNAVGRLTMGKCLLWTAIFSVALTLLGLAVFMGFLTLGDYLYNAK